MSELPYHLKRFEVLSGALDIIRMLSTQADKTASTDNICSVLSLSDRAFSKAAERLISTGYIRPAAHYTYQLTTKGQQAAIEIAHHDAQSKQNTPPSASLQTVTRHLIIALPRKLIAGQPSNFVVGFTPEESPDELQLVLRVGAINAGISGDDIQILKLTGAGHQRTMTITPGYYRQARLRAEVFQTVSDSEDIINCGGLYADIPITRHGSEGPWTAFGRNLQFRSTP